MTVQTCGACIGARARWTRVYERETRAAVQDELRASRLERRKERAHRQARFIEQAIELRFEAAQHRQKAKHAWTLLMRIPAVRDCNVCLGRGALAMPGTFVRGIAETVA